MAKEKLNAGKVRRDEEIISIGNQMSNVMFNLKQWPVSRLLTEHDRKQFAMLQSQWDAAKDKYRQSLKRKVKP